VRAARPDKRVDVSEQDRRAGRHGRVCTAQLKISNIVCHIATQFGRHEPVTS
jgi:hypothetical protein